uniref:Uncharacterized protein n=1 Tax=Rhizophora mucronata TaxID=61149 RepID=A0A2P2PGJ4_RHIMU
MVDLVRLIKLKMTSLHSQHSSKHWQLSIIYPLM